MSEYRAVFARNARGRKPPLHIAAYDATSPGAARRIRMADKTLCHVFAAHYPESGNMGRPQSATCAACKRTYARITNK